MAFKEKPFQAYLSAVNMELEKCAEHPATRAEAKAEFFLGWQREPGSVELGARTILLCRRYSRTISTGKRA